MTYKGRLPQTPICVDSFTKKQLESLHRSSLNSSCQMLFFLSHMHSDHTEGLNEAWNTSPIYCSKITAALVRAKYGLSADKVVGLPNDRPVDLPLSSLSIRPNNGMLDPNDDLSSPHHSTDDETEASSRHVVRPVAPGFVRVRLITVSHCPGACAFIFDGYWGRYVYTGDLRYDRSTQIAFRQALQEQSAPVDLALIDNTFGASRFSNFLSTIEAINAAVSVIQQNPNCDILINSDLIGKEEILIGIASRMQCLICVDVEKYTCLKALFDAEFSFHPFLDGLSEEETDKLHESGIDYREYMSYPHWFDCFTTSEHDTYIRVWPKRFVSRAAIDSINSERSATARRAIGIYMSGWTSDIPRSHTCTHFHHINYSAHSSFTELRNLIADLRPRQPLAISSDQCDWSQFVSLFDPTLSAPVVIPPELIRSREPRGTKRSTPQRSTPQRSPSAEPTHEPKRRAFNIPMFIDDSDSEKEEREAARLAQRRASRSLQWNVDPVPAITSFGQIDLCSLSQDHEPSTTPQPIAESDCDDVDLIDPTSESRFIPLDKRRWSLKIDPSRSRFLSCISMSDLIDVSIPAKDGHSSSPSSPSHSNYVASTTSVASTGPSSTSRVAPLTEERLRYLEHLYAQPRASIVRGRLPLTMRAAGPLDPPSQPKSKTTRPLPSVVFNPYS